MRFLFVEAPVDPAQRLAMLDSAGAVIGRLPVFTPDALDEKPVAGPARLAAGRAGGSRWRGYGFGSCVELAVGGGGPECGSVVRADQTARSQWSDAARGSPC